MVVNVSINGAGRIGIIFFRILADKINRGEVQHVNLALINDPFATLEDIKYRMTYDSAHGRYKHEVKICEESKTICVGDKVKVAFCTERDPAKVPYSKHDIKIVIECSGVFTEYDKAIQHITGGVKHVVISAPAKGEQVKTLVFGVNHDQFDPSKHNVVSNASCTTNCLAPLLKVLKDDYGIKWGYITTTHAATATQKVVDGVSQKDFASGRSIFNNIIPASTGAARAIGKVYPDLEGKLDGIALRVPTIDVSVTDYIVQTEKPVTKESVKASFNKAASKDGSLHGILAVAHQAAVSSDFLGDSHSSIVEMDKIMVNEESKVVKGLSFYDNEFGYSTRLTDLTLFIASKL